MSRQIFWRKETTPSGSLILIIRLKIDLKDSLRFQIKIRFEMYNYGKFVLNIK